MLAESESEWAAALDRVRPRVAVLYEDSFNYLSKMCLLRMREAALTMLAAARERGIPTIVAGSDASDHADVYLNAGAQLVIVGEGEATLVEALDVITKRRAGELRSVAGICSKGTDGRVERTRPREILKRLEVLPRPAWDLVDVERYRTIWRERHGYFSMNLATTRGCPYHCNWCAKPIYGQRYTARSPDDVVDEMLWLKQSYRPDHLWIADDIFGLKPGWIERFADLVTARDVRIPFKCLLRADGVSEATAQALARAGCRTAWIGAESGSQRILDAMEKGIRVDQIASAAARLKKQGIEVGFFLQFGYPGETRDDIDRTLQMVRECRPDDIGVSVSYPLPGTTFFERVKAELGDKQNWVDSNDLSTMYRATYRPEFYRHLHRVVHAELRTRRGADAFMRILRRKRAIDWRGARELITGLFHAARLPALRHRLEVLGRAAHPSATIVLPVLSQQAAAIPSEQSH
jgi:anaerobic magnesium-protoporphyrin IX monomethyl ester cyclase